MLSNLEEAIGIVMDLARENVIEEHYADEDEGMLAMRKQQLAAIDTVEEFFNNQVFSPVTN